MNMPANSTQDSANADPMDDIANLFVGDEDNDVDNDDQDLDESQEDESTDIDDESDENEDEEEESSDADDDEDTIESVLGISEDKLAFDKDGKLLGVKTKVNGVEETLKLDEVLSGYQNNKHNTQKSQFIAEEKKVFDQQRDIIAETYSSKLDNVDALAGLLEQQLVGEYQNIDWSVLRAEQPAEYAALQQDFQVRSQQVQQAKDAINQDREKHLEDYKQQTGTRHQEGMKKQFDLMLQNNPTWTSESARKEALSELKTFTMEQYGFSESDFNVVQDARVIEMIKDAAAFRRGSKKVKTKKSKKLPKFQKSSGKSSKVSKLDRLIKRASKTTGAGQREAQVDAISELIG